MQTFTTSKSYTSSELDYAAQTESKVLALLWSTVAGTTMLASTLAAFWVSALLVALGALITFFIKRDGQNTKAQKVRADKYSHASVCIWQLNREA